MPKSIWTTLTDEEKDDLVKRRYQDEEDMSILAEELDMYLPTLERRIREWRKIQGERLSLFKFEKEEEEDRNNFKKEVNGNNAELTGPQGRIVSLDQLLEKCEVDLEEWKVERYLVNKWEIARKQTEKDLEWTAGVVDGFTRDTGKFFTSPLFQVKAWLVRRKPIELFPTVQPVSYNITLPEDRYIFNDEDRPLGRSLIVPDMHVGFHRNFETGELIPYHDRGAMSIVVAAAKDLQPDTIVFLGDNMDLPDWSDKFIRSPDFRNITQPAIDELAWWLSQFRGLCPDSKMVYLEGNHEHRMVKALQSSMIAAYDVRPASKVSYPPAMSIPSLLELDKIDVQWVGDYPEGEYWISDDLVAVHGAKARAGGGDTAKAMLATFDTSVLFGHIHRQEVVVKSRKVRGGIDHIRAVCFGALCMMDGTVPGHTSAQNWSKGFGIVFSDSEGDNIVPIEIKNKRAVFPGHIYQEVDFLPVIRRDLSHWKGL